MMVADILAEQGHREDVMNTYRLSDVRAIQSTPLVTPGRFVGMLSTYWSEPHDPARHDYRAFDIYARWAAALIERAQSVAALRASDAHQKVLVAELQHRTRNLIAVVHALANVGVGTARSLEEFNDVFGQRLGALSRVQGMLSQPEPITIGELVRMELDAVIAGAMRDRVRLSGPEVELRHFMIQTVAIALHELATNALKHGSIGRDGSLDVTWCLIKGQPDRLVLEWREEGPEFSPEERRAARPGYGRELIERALPYSLGAETTFELLPSGVFCKVDLPLSRPERRRR